MNLSIEEKLNEWFTYHAPTEDQIPKYNAIRQAARDFADVIVQNTPSCADQTVALRRIRECAMIANQAIACRGI